MLLGRETFAAAGVLLICNGPYNDSIKFFSKKRDVVSDVRSMFTENFAEIYRNAILRASNQKQYFKWENTREIFIHSISGLGYVGNVKDVTLPKKYTDLEDGSHAIGAIKRIESRSRISTVYGP